MVAVGDRHGLGGGDGDQLVDGIARETVRRDDPQSMAHTLIVDDIDGSGADRKGCEDVAGSPARIVVQADDRARVHAGCPQEAIAVLAGDSERPLVGQNAGAWLERLQTEAGEEAALRSLDIRARHAIDLLVDVDRRPRILVERPVGAPSGECPGGPTVAIVLGITRLLDRCIEPDDVSGIAREIASAIGGREHVVRRRDDHPRVGDRVGRIAQGAKRTDLGHGFLGSTGVRRAGRVGRRPARGVETH